MSQQPFQQGMSKEEVYSKFRLKKGRILNSLAAPSELYTDLSPKGSVDIGIKNLIDRLNQLDGIVTTSSCAGRITVFLEGSKGRQFFANDGTSEVDNNGEQKVVLGGKGRGGRWLFVSHDPVQIPAKDHIDDRPLSRLFGLSQQRQPCLLADIDKSRFVRFQFEPMILHIMAASLHHAEPVLSAAINAGFRESGIQSLKNLSDPNACPMVAIRSSGLALESLIGAIEDSTTTEEISAIVNEEYLETLLSLANQRFGSNSERTKRFSENLFERKPKVQPKWEDQITRNARKRAEGLKKKEWLQAQRTLQQADDTTEFSESRDDHRI